MGQRPFAAVRAAAVLLCAVLALPGSASASVTAPVSTVVGLSGPTAASYGATVRVTGYLRTSPGGTAIAGQKVVVQRSARNQNKWSALRTITTGNGSFAFDVTQSTAYDYRAVYAGSTAYKPATGATYYPAVLRKVILDSIKTTDYASGRLQVSGRVYPAGPKVQLQRWVAASRTWKTIGTFTGSGTAVKVDATVGGSVLTYRLYSPMAFPYGAGSSKARSFQHFVWRGVFKKPLLARGGTANPEFNVLPASEVPALSEADLLADRTGTVWGDLNTRGCTKIKAWFGNLTDGTVRTSLLNGTTVIGAVNQPQESETELIRSLAGSTRTRLQVQDTNSGYGPSVATDTYVLCNN
ncbi:hypothetical protein [Kribbella deserti]|uniref:Carboxypeptidase regulatory-like domain-containing protein n=1 Tax=Kribbella deserti TaxID=1926257 RepID=A0ABV6QYF6_9ACTN